jgi:hypothetical protein
VPVLKPKTHNRELSGRYNLPEDRDVLRQYVRDRYTTKGFKLPAWVVAYHHLHNLFPELTYSYNFSRKSESIYLYVVGEGLKLCIRFSTHNNFSSFSHCDWVVGADGKRIVKWLEVKSQVIERINTHRAKFINRSTSNDEPACS